MASLDQVADKVVRDAVDAFMAGTHKPDFSGETVFETKNSRYRLLDGVVFAAPDPSLVGAELVGWLVEHARHSVVESAWLPGARAVLVDRSGARNIIVTSSTKLLHVEDSSSSEAFAPRRAAIPTPLPVPQAPFQPRSAPIVPSTPPPPLAGIPSPLPPAALFSMGPQAAPNPAPASPAQKRAPAVHLPPRPIAISPRNATSSPIPALRPLPVPVPPPRQEAHRNVEPPPPAADDWELTSGDIQLDEDSSEVETTRAQHLYASRQNSPDGEVPESVGPPIPLVRPVRR